MRKGESAIGAEVGRDVTRRWRKVGGRAVPGEQKEQLVTGVGGRATRVREGRRW